jgi:hypothetical protein
MNTWILSRRSCELIRIAASNISMSSKQHLARMTITKCPNDIYLWSDQTWYLSGSRTFSTLMRVLGFGRVYKLFGCPLYFSPVPQIRHLSRPGIIPRIFEIIGWFLLQWISMRLSLAIVSFWEVHFTTYFLASVYFVVLCHFVKCHILSILDTWSANCRGNEKRGTGIEPAADGMSKRCYNMGKS